MKSSLKTTKITFTVIMIIGLLLVGLVAYITVNGSYTGKKPPKPTPTEAATPTVTQPLVKLDGDTKADAIVLGVDEKAGIVRVYEPEHDITLELFYTGSTDIRNRFNQVISAGLIETGTIAEVSFDMADRRLYHLYISNDSWKAEAPQSWDIFIDKGLMRVGDRNYRISSNVAILAGEDEYLLSSVSDMDVINVYGKEARVFAIEIVSGHGTIFAMNEDDFIGGSFFVDNVYAGQITKDFALNIREGRYEVSFSLGDLNGKETVDVNRNGTVVVNMKPYVEEAVEYGYVKFIITPDDAMLFIDSFKYDSAEEIKLAYGSHSVEIMKKGYQSWNSTIIVGTEQQKYTVSLAEINYAPTPTPSPEITDEPELTPTPYEPDASPTPELSGTPAPTPTGATEPGDSTSEKSMEITLVWYPSSVITLDSVYVGTTDGSGTLLVDIPFGNHVIGCTRTTIDGATAPESYSITVDADTSRYISLPTR